MNFRNSNGLVAAAVALALGSTAAHAVVDPTNPINANPPTVTIYSAGGSAQTNAAFTAAWNLLNVSASYTGSGSATNSGLDGSYRVLYGTLKAAYTANGTTVPSGTVVLYFYKFNGGSFPNGAEPQAQVSPTTLKYTSLTSLQNAVSTGAALSGTAANWEYTNDQGLTTAPDWGITDEEVPLFNFPYNLPYANGTTYISGTFATEVPATVGQSDAIYDDVFGIAVTANVFALKTSFSKEEIGCIWTGVCTDWGQILGDNGSPVAASGAHPIIFLDRNKGSGTKASGSLYFLNYPTGIATGSFAVPASIKFASTFARYVKVSTEQGLGGSGYEDVIDSSSANLVSDLVAAQGNGDYAIGITSVETAPIVSSNAWDFTAINNQTIDSVGNVNGASTNYSNVIKGAYDYFYQNSFNTRTNFLAGTSNNQVLANAWRAEFSLPAFAGVVSHTAYPSAVNGILLDADKASAYGAGVTTGSRKAVSESPLATLYDGSNAITTTISGNADPL